MVVGHQDDSLQDLLDWKRHVVTTCECTLYASYSLLVLNLMLQAQRASPVVEDYLLVIEKEIERQRIFSISILTSTVDFL